MSLPYRLLFFLSFVLVSPLSARCQQSQLDVSTNYSYLRANPAGNAESFDSDGGSISASRRLNSWVGLAADFGGYNFREQPVGVSGHLFTYTVGPRFSSRREVFRATPFGHALVGGARISGNLSGPNAGENGLAVVVGGGLDVRINSVVAIRVFEADYLLTRFNRVNNMPGVQNDVRVSAGVVLHFGRR
jgi:hypothetical protein